VQANESGLGSTTETAPEDNPTRAKGLDQDHTASFTPEHKAEIERRGFTADDAVAAGVLSITSADQIPEGYPDYWRTMLPAMLLPWRHGDAVEWQIMPDDREKFDKYLFRPDAKVPLIKHRDQGVGTVLIVEGFWQSIAASTYDRSAGAVYGMAGVNGWSHADLSIAIGRPVIVLPDGDLRTNYSVHDAIESLMETLNFAGAESIKVASLPAQPKSQGLDDLLQRFPEAQRANILANVMKSATEKLPRKPAKKRAKKPGPSSRFFDLETGSFLAETLARVVFDQAPLLLTREENIAVYRDGVYRIDKLGLMAVVSELLGEEYRPHLLTTVTDKLASALSSLKMIAPDRQPEPLLNCPNGMVDLRSGERLDHDPDFLSTIQIPIEYDPAATCPTFDDWLQSQIPDQIEDLEEVISQMLDPSATPKRALFAYGPARSGKSTILRIMEAIAGIENVSGVSLHALDEAGFAPANVYNKMLNSAADLSAKEVQDLSVFKKMTGEDLIHGNRKFGKQFFFRNRALFAFAANEVPQVSESSNAYRERVKPFRFGNSFAGREDPSIENKIVEHELPGVLNRWIKANQRLRHRGNFRATNSSVQHEFDVASNRVLQWVTDEMEVITTHPDGRPVTTGMELPETHATKPRVLYAKFSVWADRVGGTKLGEKRFRARVKLIPGVHDVRIKPHSLAAINVVEKREGSDTSGTSGTYEDTVRESEISTSSSEKSISADNASTSTGSTGSTRDTERARLWEKFDRSGNLREDERYQLWGKW
jgi:putative DNA primase/helicase